MTRHLHPHPVAPPLASGRDGWPWQEAARSKPAHIRARADWPRITIVTPSFNQGDFLEETLRSVLLQGYPNLEHIVMDGGSTDGSAGIIRHYEPWLTHWASEKDNGQSDAINRGMAMATGEICAWLNSDDILTADALWTVGDYFARHPECRWLAGAGRLDFLDSGRRGVMESRQIHPDGFLEFWHFGGGGSFVFQPSAFWRRDLWREVGGLDEAMHYAMDYQLWLDFAERTDLHALDDVLSAAKRHDRCKTVAGHDKQIAELMDTAYRMARRYGISGAQLTAHMMSWRFLQQLRSAKHRWERGERTGVSGPLKDVLFKPLALISAHGRIRALTGE